MKIYLAGAHSTGKSTLARHIAKEYKLPMITEVARSVLSEKELSLKQLRTDLSTANDFQKAIFYRQIQKEKEIDSFVSDRCIDCLAYTANHTSILNEIKNTKEYEDYVKSLKETNSLIFFIRPAKETMAADGVREELTWEGMITIDAMIKCLFEFENIKYVQINTPNMQERIMTIETIIDKLI
jgi:nicotinamide riboside kinase